jgi:hypothetical protein
MRWWWYPILVACWTGIAYVTYLLAEGVRKP